jgi:hypothetical protein
MARRPVDHRGYTVPWFVEIVDGVPDHRVTSEEKRRDALRGHRCWLCGEKLSHLQTLTIGPMCCLTRTTSEPGSHYECAQWAVRACPFLTRPHAHRRTAALPEDTHDMPGLGLKRNPGAVALWTTREVRAFDVQRDPATGVRAGALLRVGDPTRVEVYTEGRRATPEEFVDSLVRGVPVLVASSGLQPADLTAAWIDLSSLWTDLAEALMLCWRDGAAAMLEATARLPDLVRSGLDDARSRSAAGSSAGNDSQRPGGDSV